MSEIALMRNCYSNFMLSITFKVFSRIYANRDRNYKGTKQQ